tara:strand:+ start:755 stop:1327 length:573 start_codon:yes stop_codon:yes gene_type:complete
MMFGFGKVKINYGELLVEYSAGAWTIEKQLAKAWECDGSLPEFNKNLDKIQAACNQLSRGLVRFLLPEEVKSDFETYAMIHEAKSYLEEEANTDKTYKNFLEWRDEIITKMSVDSIGSPEKTFLKGVLLVLDVDEDKLEIYIEKLHLNFPVELIQGFIAQKQSFLQNKKVVENSEDEELWSWHLNNYKES